MEEKNCGSSPPTRGTPPLSRAGSLLRRFIPAHAGNTTFRTRAATSRSVHPRPRGEHFICASWDSSPRGSSPPTRGTLRCLGGGSTQNRFIPAHAGNTSKKSTWRLHVTVHPRPRGEHTKRKKPSDAGLGSSPPTRGTPRDAEIRHFVERFIPAHAGNTVRGWDTLGPMPVHPRPRGEHVRTRTVSARQRGSSPPTRGTPPSSTEKKSTHRFIPAHAGNTANCAARAFKATVHPRPRGEHAVVVTPVEAPLGSSPPTRGTQEYRGCTVEYFRFIPAHAGNTLTASP